MKKVLFKKKTKDYFDVKWADRECPDCGKIVNEKYMIWGGECWLCKECFSKKKSTKE